MSVSPRRGRPAHRATSHASHAGPFAPPAACVATASSSARRSRCCSRSARGKEPPVAIGSGQERLARSSPGFRGPTGPLGVTRSSTRPRGLCAMLGRTGASQCRDQRDLAWKLRAGGRTARRRTRIHQVVGRRAAIQGKCGDRRVGGSPRSSRSSPESPAACWRSCSTRAAKFVLFRPEVIRDGSTGAANPNEKTKVGRREGIARLTPRGLVRGHGARR